MSSPWLAWVAVSIVAAIGGAYGLAIVGFRSVELAVMAFAWGMVWCALTPRLLRTLSRWVR